MKTFIPLALAAGVTVCAVSSFAAEKPEIVENYLPIGKLTEGAVVSVELDEGMNAIMQKIDGVFADLSEQDKKDLVKQIIPGEPFPYDKRLGITEDEYKAYLESWDKRKIQEIAPVAVGVISSAQRGFWNLTTLTEGGPLPMSTLRYDSEKKAWISPNGLLTLGNDVDYSPSNLYGAWSGKEWVLEKKDGDSTLTEKLILGKSKDGKYAYLIYTLNEVSELGGQVAGESYAVRIPIVNVSDDPLLERAKSRSKK